MITYSLIPQSREPVYYSSVYRPISLAPPVQIDENYFDRLAAFGLACLVAAFVGKLLMASVYR